MSTVNPEILQELLLLPDYLRKTQLSLMKIGRGAAEDVAKLTGRHRAHESQYLNFLAEQGKITKERRGNYVIYGIKERSQNLATEIRSLPQEIQEILIEDLYCAFQNRLAVLLRCVKDGRRS